MQERERDQAEREDDNIGDDDGGGSDDDIWEEERVITSIKLGQKKSKKDTGNNGIEKKPYPTRY